MPTDESKIHNAKVTVYFDGLITFCFTEKPVIGQAGILTTMQDHTLRIIVRAKGQMGHTWPPLNGRGEIPIISYTRFKKWRALNIYLSETSDGPVPDGSAKEITGSSPFSFNNIFEFNKRHKNEIGAGNKVMIRTNTFAPINFPQGYFYSAGNMSVNVEKNGNSTSESISYLGAAALVHEGSEPEYLILGPELVAGEESDNFLPSFEHPIKLVRGLQYEVIVQNSPIESLVNAPNPGHFSAYYDAICKPGGSVFGTTERYNVKISDLKSLPDNPPCVNTKISNRQMLPWNPSEMSTASISRRRHNHNEHKH